MEKEKEFLTVIKSLGEVLEKRDMDILIQGYEIENLKSTIAELENKLVKNGVILIHKD